MDIEKKTLSRKALCFPITSNDATNTLKQIHHVTNSFSGINPEYIGKMTETIHKRKITWVGTIEAPTDIAVMKQIIGKNGFHLKNFTNKYAVELIWHDRLTNTFMVWGNKRCIIAALHAINRQIKRISAKHIEGLTEHLMTLAMTRSREDDTIMGEPERKRMKCDANEM